MSLRDRLNRLERGEPDPADVIELTPEEWADLHRDYVPGERPSEAMELLFELTAAGKPVPDALMNGSYEERMEVVRRYRAEHVNRRKKR